MQVTFDASGDLVAITGGAQGIGAAIARGVAERGGTAVVLDVVESEELAGLDHVIQLKVDVSDRDAVFAAIGRVVEEHGPVTGLVAGAAIQPRTAIAEMDPEEWHRVLAVNLDGVLWAVQAVLPGMKKAQDGSIIVYSSGLAHIGHATASAYAASKAALIPFAKSLAGEVIDDHIRVNILFPGVVDTEQFRVANPSGGQREHWERTTSTLR